jgi:hypothetical protein
MQDIDSIRLQLTPSPTDEHDDGAWWPRSTQLTAELPDLVTGLSDRLGQLRLVGYHSTAWPQTPPQTEINGQTVELVGFTSDQPASVILVGNDGRHVSLTVIAPGADQQRAHDLMAKAAERRGARARSSAARNLIEVAEKLAEHEGGDGERRTQIALWVDQAAEQFVDAPIQTFVPILVEHVVRNQIFATRESRLFPIIEVDAATAGEHRPCS